MVGKRTQGFHFGGSVMPWGFLWGQIKRSKGKGAKNWGQGEEGKTGSKTTIG